MPDALVALPLALSRQRARGFDQATEIARRVARVTGVPMATGLRRARDTPAQAALPWKDRAANVRGAFVADFVPRDAHRHRRRRDDHRRNARRRGPRGTAGRRPGVEAWAVARTLPPAHPP